MSSANAEDHAGSRGSPIFTAVLTPHRSLTPRGFLAVMAVLAVMSFTAGLIFWSIGAWPVIGFMGLDVALVYAAFRLNFRQARAAEIISLTREQLTVRRIAADGRSAETAVNPYWARLEIDRHPEFGILRMAIASHGNRFAIGRFLVPDEREKYARSLTAALAEVRSTPAQ